MDCEENFRCPEDRILTWIVTNESRTAERFVVENWMSGKIVVYGSLLSVWIVLLNTALCSVFVVTSQGKRGFSIGSQMSCLRANFSLVQLLIGAVVIPGTLAIEFNGVWPLGPGLCRLWLVLKVAFVAVTFWSLAAMTMYCVLDRVLFTHQLWTGQGKTSSGLALAAVWFLSGFSVLPLLISFADDDVILEDVCASSTSKADAVVVLITSFLFPVCFLIAGSAVIVCSRPTSGDERRPVVDPDDSGFRWKSDETPEPEAYVRLLDTPPSSTVLSAIGLCSVVTWSPLLAVSALVPFCDGTTCVDPGLWTLVLWIGYANSGLAPCLWFADPGVRKAGRSTIIRLSFVSICRRNQTIETPAESSK